MSKIICDICGTSYSETATQCPICGKVRPADAVVVESDSPEQEAGGYTFVKGGRFSKSNVRKRAQESKKQGSSKTASGAMSGQEDTERKKKAIGLIIVLAVLVLLIGLLIVYLAFIWGPGSGDGDDTPVETTDSVEIPCTGITLSTYDFSMTELNQVLMLSVTKNPLNTTDIPYFSSDNEAVATVTQSGKITCVGEGKATITVKCGDQQVQCRVVCELETGDDTPEYSLDELRFNRTSITADSEGYIWTLYSGSIPVNEITWTSDDESVAVISNGVVSVVGEGTTYVHASYGGKTVSCEIIYDGTDHSGTGGITEDQGEQGSNTGTVTDEGVRMVSQFGSLPYGTNVAGMYEMTIKVGEKFAIYLVDSQGNRLDVTWHVEGYVSEDTSCKVEGNIIECFSNATNDKVYCEYNGTVYSCIVITRAAS